jgi:hypothetical protein
MGEIVAGFKKKYCHLPGESEENQENFRTVGVPTETFVFIYLYHPHKYYMQIKIIIFKLGL